MFIIEYSEGDHQVMVETLDEAREWIRDRCKWDHNFFEHDLVGVRPEGHWIDHYKLMEGHW